MIASLTLIAALLVAPASANIPDDVKHLGDLSQRISMVAVDGLYDERECIATVKTLIPEDPKADLTLVHSQIQECLEIAENNTNELFDNLEKLAWIGNTYNDDQWQHGYLAFIHGAIGQAYQRMVAVEVVLSDLTTTISGSQTRDTLLKLEEDLNP